MQPIKISNFSINFEHFAIGIVSFLFIVIRLRLLDFPFERDEGEYAYMGKLLLEGLPPYQGAYNMKLPGTNIFYSLFIELFGQTPSGIHFGLLLLNLTSTFFIYKISEHFIENSSAKIAILSFFLIFTISPNVLGFAAHATHFVVFWVLLTLFYYFQFPNSKFKPFIIGLFLGLALLSKQQGLFYFILGMFLIWKTEKTNIIYYILYLIGYVLPVFVLITILLYSNTFDNFKFWVVDYALKYGSNTSLSDGLSNFSLSIQKITNGQLLVITLLIAGIVYILVNFKSKNYNLLLVIGITSVLGVSSGLYFREHYFILLAPFLSIIFGLGLSWIKNQKLQLGILLVILLTNVFLFKEYYFLKPTIQLSKEIYGINPFAESKILAEIIQKNTKETDKIAILGSEPQLFCLSNRKSATGYIYTYALVENQPFNLKMQQEMIKEIESSKPELILFVNISYSWLAKKEAPTLIFDWYAEYVKNNYVLINYLDIFPNADAIVVEKDFLSMYQPQSGSSIYIYKKITK